MTPCIVVRRSVYEELGGFDDRLACAEDWEMWVRLAARFPVYYEERPLACYRLHGNSNTEGTCATGRVSNTRGGRSSSSPRTSSRPKGAPSNEPPSRATPRRARDRARPAVAGRRRRGARRCESSGGSRSHRGPPRIARVVAGSLAAEATDRRRCDEAGRRARALDAAREPRSRRVRRSARSYYAPALTRLLAGAGSIGSALRPQLGTDEEVAALLPTGAVAPSWEDVLNGPTSSRSSPRRRSHTPSRYGRCSSTESTSSVRSRSSSTAPQERASSTWPESVVSSARPAWFGASRARPACSDSSFRRNGLPARVARGNPFRWPVDSPAYFAPEAGNQPLWDIGSHVVDLLSGGSAFRTTSRAATTRWAGPRRTACSSSNGGRLQRRGAAEPSTTSRAGSSSSGRQGSSLCRNVIEADVLRGSRQVAAPDFEQRIPGRPHLQDERSPTASSSSSRFAAVRGVAPLWAPAEDVLEGSERSRRWRPKASSSSRRLKPS